MKLTYQAMTLMLVGSLGSCTKEQAREAPQVQPTFSGLAPADTNTLLVRQYAAGTGFATLLATAMITEAQDDYYQMHNDTTSVRITNWQAAIVPGYDWQIEVPALRKTVRLTGISSEQRSEKVGWGIFSLETGPKCQNPIFSLEQDGQPITFTQQTGSNSLYPEYRIFIRR